MEVATITMDRNEARAKLKSLRAAKHREVEDEYAGIEAGYKALAAGTPIIKLSESIIAAGVDDQLRPKLAVCDARCRSCVVQMDSDRWIFKGILRGESHWQVRKNRAMQFVHRRSEWRHKRRNDDGQWFYTNARAEGLVPIVPAEIRPRKDLAGLLILWEAEWGPVSPVDPMLLKPLAGDLYAVLAQWDLTEIERAVLAGRLTT